MTIKLRCPKCRKQNLTVTRSQVEQIMQTVEDGKVTASYLSGGLMAEVLRVDAVCDCCGHEWRVRDTNGWDEEVEPKAAAQEGASHG